MTSRPVAGLPHSTGPRRIGHPFTATLMPSGQGPHWLPLRAALCQLIGKREAGEQVAVHLHQRFS